MGRVRRAFGLKGELFVVPITDEPGEVFAPGRRVNAVADDAHGTSVPRDCVVERSRPFKDGWLVKLDCVADKTEADRWGGVVLRVPFAELAAPVENEVYLHELDGMTVRDEPHGELGVVAGWYQLPQGIVLEVRGPAWRADVPFNEAFVERVDRTARTIVVTLPEGLLEVVH